MPNDNPEIDIEERAYYQLYNFFMEGRGWTPAEDMEAYFEWHEGVADCEWLPDFWNDTREPDFLLWLLGRVWARGELLRPWREWHGLEQFIDWCVSIAGLDASALDTQPIHREGLEAMKEWFAFDGPDLISRARRAAVRAAERLAVDGSAPEGVRTHLADTLRRFINNPFTEEAGFVIPEPTQGQEVAASKRTCE